MYIPIEKLPPAHADSEELPPVLLPALRLAAALGLWRPDCFQPDCLQQPHHLQRGTGDGQRQPVRAATG